jgi:hypothetical protein
MGCICKLSLHLNSLAIGTFISYPLILFLYCSPNVIRTNLKVPKFFRINIQPSFLPFKSNARDSSPTMHPVPTFNIPAPLGAMVPSFKPTLCSLSCTVPLILDLNVPHPAGLNIPLISLHLIHRNNGPTFQIAIAATVRV